jgi:MFS family permease
MAGAILLVPLGLEPLASASALLFGLMMSGLPAVIAAHLSDFLTAREFAGAFGRCTLAFGLAQLCGPPLGGFLAETAGGFLVPFLLAGFVAAVGAALSLDVLRTTTPRRPLQQGPDNSWQPVVDRGRARWDGGGVDPDRRGSEDVT